MGFVTDKPPFSFEDSSGVHTGIEIDLMRTALAAMGMAMEVTLVPNTRTTRMVKAGAIDVAASVQGRDGEGLFFSDPVFKYRNVIVSRKARRLTVRSLADVDQHSFVIWQDGWRHLGPEFMAKYRPNEKGEFRRNYSQATNQEAQSRMFWSGRSELIIVDRAIFEYYRKKLRKELDTDAELVYHNIFDKPTEFAVAFREPELRDRFNAVLHRLLEDGAYQAILDQYR